MFISLKSDKQLLDLFIMDIVDTESESSLFLIFSSERLHIK